MWSALCEKLENIYLEDFEFVDSGIVTSEIFNVDDFIKMMISAGDKEVDEEDSVDKLPPSWQGDLTAIRAIRQFISATFHMVVGANSYLNCVEMRLLFI